jgi:hypothetical protein
MFRAAKVLRQDIARRAGRGRGSGAAAQHLAPPPLGGVCFADLDFSEVAFASSGDRSLAGLVVATPRGGLRTGGGGVDRRLGFWRGYAAAGYSGTRGGGGPTSRRRDDYEGPREVSPKFFINGQLKGSKSAEAILFLVDEHGDDFDFIHVSAAVNTLYKVATPESAKMLTEGDRFAKLIDLVRDGCKKFKAHAIANVLHGLAVLHADQILGCTRCTRS